MEKLKEKQTKVNDGITIFLLDRIGDYVLVCSYTTEGYYFSGFEVHRISVTKERTSIIGVVRVDFKSGEHYRSSTEFGHYAWAYPNLVAMYQVHPQFKVHGGRINEKWVEVKQSFPVCQQVC